MRLNSHQTRWLQVVARPTHFQLPGQLVRGGPKRLRQSPTSWTRCAGYWAIKASELRANHTGRDLQRHHQPQARQPLQRELVFDNHDHRAGGQCFTEIAVKRVLTRDGTSSYINNQPVRRATCRTCSWARPGAARLRHHRPGTDQPHHRKPA